MSEDYDYSKEIIERLVKIEVKIDGIKELEKKVIELEKHNVNQEKDIENVRDDISKVQDNLKWITRLVGSTIITAILGAVIALL